MCMIILEASICWIVLPNTNQVKNSSNNFYKSKVPYTQYVPLI